MNTSEQRKVEDTHKGFALEAVGVDYDGTVRPIATLTTSYGLSDLRRVYRWYRLQRDLFEAMMRRHSCPKELLL